ncbi:hypothetical protein Ocin01_03546 [Orchesella cincta]|uniref:Uncharacterized protein n=1 Tax=Orchesella cincta TaxID=48709 RepID=A0A1D2NDG7_ORCCI|nr:hypothetical protein Ocin01_03546 [Orchesella cincta]
MAYNLPPPPLDGGGPDFGGGIPFGFPGFGKSFNLDVGAGFGGPGAGFFGGGFPGWGGPYVPVTPLGGLWGFKGDLIVPIVAIGVAIFILILIVLAVKYALAWKLEVLDDLAGNKKWKREAGDAPAVQLQDSNLNKLADIVAAAVYSEGCSRRILCEIGTYARDGKQYPSLLRLMELVVPEEYQGSFTVVRQSAEGQFDCSEHYPCGDKSKNPPNPADNEVDTSPNNQSKPVPEDSQSSASGNATTPASSSPTFGTTPAPSGPQAVFGKFKRAMMKD